MNATIARKQNIGIAELLDQFSETPSWVGAVCAEPGNDPEAWFPFPGEDYTPAAQLCDTCPLKARCLAWAERTGQTVGVWGGKDFDPRRGVPRRG